jgi:hypothetical protein
MKIGFSSRKKLLDSAKHDCTSNTVTIATDTKYRTVLFVLLEKNNYMYFHYLIPCFKNAVSEVPNFVLGHIQIYSHLYEDIIGAYK